MGENKNNCREIFDRLKERLECKTDSALGVHMGIAAQYVNRCLAENRIPFKAVHALCSKEDISLDYLFGSVTDSGQTVSVPFYDKIELSAGSGSFMDDSSIVRVLIPRTFISGMSNNLCLTRVRGDSMEPTLSNNTLVIIDLDDVAIVDGKTFAVEYDGSLFVKNIQCLGANSIQLVSVNRIYSPILVESNRSFKVLGRVRGFYSFL